MVRIVHISDTHNNTTKNIPECDILIHSGDLGIMGDLQEIRRGLHWLKDQPAKYKVLVPGNHEVCFDDDHLDGLDSEEVLELLQSIPEEYGVNVLLNSSIELEGLTLTGCSLQPPFMGWAFGADSSMRAQVYKNLLANNPDILITHCPPNGILDTNAERIPIHVGCPMLRTLLVHQLDKPDNKLKLHCFGHIHESSGVYIDSNGMIYSNAACRTNYFNLEF